MQIFTSMRPLELISQVLGSAHAASLQVVIATAHKAMPWTIPSASWSDARPSKIQPQRAISNRLPKTTKRENVRLRDKKSPQSVQRRPHDVCWGPWGRSGKRYNVLVIVASGGPGTHHKIKNVLRRQIPGGQ